MKCDKCGHNMPVDPYRTVDVKAKSFARKMKVPWDKIMKVPWGSIGIACIAISAGLGFSFIIVNASIASDAPTYCYTDSNRMGVTWLKGNVEWDDDVNLANNDPKYYTQFCEKGDKVYDCYKRICSDLNLEFHHTKK